ncbi:YicC/YloC family endoribonuclease [Desulfopila aestuarii]|uniref:TIGR00255 family protein n=1 Tax=Desulfopila aestuarii DSM 18488 TaxID=1121416 RepID=A0A1M7Y000_9BACT|nr:YicC/YloC family endoribonuclease [Desulfopila aestuarii]SHO44597.1 TIGR00255 family protein [Desulfopila aestuarii DSM 18488]
MAVRSMTGFGRGEAEKSGRLWTVELRCVNNRFLDLKSKLPKGYMILEEPIRKKVSEFHQRGRVDLALSVSGDFSDLLHVKVNLGLAENYRQALGQIADSFKLENTVSLAQLASYPDVLVREQEEEDIEAIWPYVEKALDAALAGCDLMRRQEGAALVDDLTTRLIGFRDTVAMIEKSIPELLQQREKHLQERLEKLLGNVEIDPQRLAQEVAILADKTDVTEEIVRLRSHIQQFENFLHEEAAVGRKLDFLIQEFLREVNTMASKINDAGIAHLTVDLKSELEKMREQVQNIE